MIASVVFVFRVAPVVMKAHHPEMSGETNRQEKEQPVRAVQSKGWSEKNQQQRQNAGRQH
jgi:hypothetical protein